MHCGREGDTDLWKIRIGMITEKSSRYILSLGSMSSRMARINPKTFNSDILV